jgi:glycosyltransferase involved in cell wall biosynthesis
MLNKCVVYVVNSDWFFLSHRLPLALEAIKRGYKVLLVTKNSGRRAEIEAHGITFVEVDIERSGKNPLKEFKLILELYRVYRKYRPEIIHHVTLKPALYGTIAAKMLNYKPEIINAVTGLGYLFLEDRKSVAKSIVHAMMRYAYKDRSTKFIFQNPDDRGMYEKMGFLTPENNIIIKGSGVDTNDYVFKAPAPKDKLRILFPARMLFDKGIPEFVGAAHLLRKQYEGKMEFVLAGGIDKLNPGAITEEELKALLIPGYIIWTGHVSNMKAEYTNADVVCLPSYYREGLPKSLVEAMASGRPIVTTDSTGCRECVVDGKNGFMVPIRNSEAVAAALEKLIVNPELRISMGKASREMMEKEMSLSTVITKTFDFYSA